MKKDNLLRHFLEVLEKKIPEKTKLVEKLMEILFMEKGAIYRRLRGEVPFSFYEVVNIAEKLDISLTNFVYSDSVRMDRFELNMLDYIKVSNADYNHWEKYISLISSSNSDPNSELAESSNSLPIAIYGKFDSISKFFLFKYQYLNSEIENRISFSDLVVTERLDRVIKAYFKASKNFAKNIYIWDYSIFQYFVTDVHFFSGINLISEDDIQLIKEDLFALLDYVERLTFKGYFEETGNPVSFYISDVNLDADYSYVQINDIHISRIRSFILNSVASSNHYSFYKIKNWINSLKRSSTLINHSGAVYRADFFEKQRKIISEL
jgi:hypothetical protein